MAIVVTLDQKDSRRTREDRVEQLAAKLNSDSEIVTDLPFERTIGDELQGLLREASSLPAVILDAVQEGNWWIGIGIGDVTRLAETTRASTGEAFYRARRAIERAKKQKWGVAVEDPKQPWVSELDGAIALLLLAVTDRTAGGWEAVNLKRKKITNNKIGEELRITPQAVQQRLKAAHYNLEIPGRKLVAKLAEVADLETVRRPAR